MESEGGRCIFNFDVRPNLNLPYHANYLVAVSQLYMPNQFINFKSFSMLHGTTTHLFPDRSLAMPAQVVKFMNDNWPMELKGKARMSFNQEQAAYQLEILENDVTIGFSPRLAQFLGFEKDTLYQNKKTVIAPNAFNIFSGMSVLHLICDFVQQALPSEIDGELLRLLPYQSTSSLLDFEPRNLNWFRLSRPNLSSIKISLLDEFLEPCVLQLPYTRSFGISLAFKKSSYFN